MKCAQVFRHSPSLEGAKEGKEASKQESRQVNEDEAGQRDHVWLENTNLSNICSGHVWGTARVGTLIGGTPFHLAGEEWALLGQWSLLCAWGRSVMAPVGMWNAALSGSGQSRSPVLSLWHWPGLGAGVMFSKGWFTWICTSLFSVVFSFFRFVIKWHFASDWNGHSQADGECTA